VVHGNLPPGSFVMVLVEYSTSCRFFQLSFPEEFCVLNDRKAEILLEKAKREDYNYLCEDFIEFKKCFS